MTYDDYKRRVIEAQRQWNDDRDWVYKTEGYYRGDFTGEVQPTHITTPDSFDHMTLEQMQTAVSAMKPKLVNDAAAAWSKIGMDLLDAFGLFQGEFQRTIDGQGGHPGWRGSAAKAAVDAVNHYSDQSTHLSRAATLIGLKLSEMQTGIEETQALMPGVTQHPDIKGKTSPRAVS
jgi:hypothetical protein